MDGTLRGMVASVNGASTIAATEVLADAHRQRGDTGKRAAAVVRAECVKQAGDRDRAAAEQRP